MKHAVLISTKLNIITRTFLSKWLPNIVSLYPLTSRISCLLSHPFVLNQKPLILLYTGKCILQKKRNFYGRNKNSNTGNRLMHRQHLLLLETINDTHTFK